VSQLNAALRENSSGLVVFFDVSVPLESFFREGAPMERGAFIATFQSIPPASEVTNTVRCHWWLRVPVRKALTASS
jgi:hypothetical protein